MYRGWEPGRCAEPEYLLLCQTLRNREERILRDLHRENPDAYARFRRALLEGRFRDAQRIWDFDKRELKREDHAARDAFEDGQSREAREAHISNGHQGATVISTGVLASIFNQIWTL